MAEESEDDESEKLGYCVTGLTTFHESEDDELNSYSSWRRLSE